jgi:type I restriction enzyme M protein
MIITQIVQKVWNYCNTLRDDGVSYSDYLTQLTYLLFLKMATVSFFNPKNLSKNDLNPSFN